MDVTNLIFSPGAGTKRSYRVACGHHIQRNATGEGRRAAQNLEQLAADDAAIRMGMTSAQLIREALAVNHKQVVKRTRNGYRPCLEHFAEYLQTYPHDPRNFYTAQRKHVMMFLNHLAEHGGAHPDESRKDCGWCRDRGYPDGKGGCGWSASRIKTYYSAIRFLYFHFLHDKTLPDQDPSAGIRCPTVTTRPQWSPTRDEIEALLSAPGKPKDRLLAHWVAFAPSRREPFKNALWRDIDLKEGTWDLVGKGEKADMFPLHPRLLPVLREYREWQLREAEKNPKIAAALADEDTAYVLLTYNGKPLAASTVTKTLKWRARRAGIAVIKTDAKYDCPNGETSKINAHSLRRAWGRLSLNDEENPVPIDVVSEALGHSDIATTRKHYAQTKPERAQDAVRNFLL